MPDNDHHPRDSGQRRATIVVGSIPKDSGTFTFYRSLRSGLVNYDMEVKCVTIGAKEAALCDSSFTDEGCVLLAADEHDLKTQSRVFVDWCSRQRVDIVIALNSPVILSALPHLPSDIRIVSRCATVFDHGYRITMSGKERLSSIIAVNPRQVEELADRYGAPRERIVLIPNGTDLGRFRRSANTSRGQEGELRLGYLGRIHEQKGALFLPEIVRELDSMHVPFTLTIGGKGVYEAALKRELAEYVDSDKVRFLGTVNPCDVPDFFSGIDVFLFPSLFEGSPNALLEAMAAGCVPIAWRLKGITDHMIADGHSGFLVEEGHCSELALKLQLLHRQRDRLRSMSSQAVDVAKTKFSRDRMIDAYQRLFDSVLSQPLEGGKVKPWNEFQVDRAFRQPFWRSVVPQALISKVRHALFLLRLSNRSG